jgi:hypothetical protein
VKEFLRGVSIQEAESVARAALSLSTADEVSAFLEQELRDLASSGAGIRA